MTWLVSKRLMLLYCWFMPVQNLFQSMRFMDLHLNLEGLQFRLRLILLKVLKRKITKANYSF